MDVLRSKSPSMVRKEIYIYLLAYNLLRSLMWSAGTIYGTPPLRLSMQATRNHLNNFMTQLLATSSTKRSANLSHFTQSYCSQGCSRGVA